MPQRALYRQLEAVKSAGAAVRARIGAMAAQDAELGQTLEHLLDQVGHLSEAFSIQSEAVAKLSAEKYQTLFESIDEGFCVVEVLFDDADNPVDYRFLEVNAAFERQTGMFNVTNRTVREIDPDHEAHWFQIYGKVALTGESVRFENPSAQLDRYYDVYAFRVGAPTQHLVAVLFNDISERKFIEQQRVELLEREQEARQKAEQAVMLQRIFLGMISHELRTPLASIKGFSSSLLADDVEFSPEQVREFIGIIDHEADTLTELIDQLLDVVRIQAGTLNVQPARTTVADLIDYALPQLTTLLNSHTIQYDYPASLPPVLADRQRIRQVLVNLVGNAVKFSSAGTPVRLAARQIGDHVEFSVSDQGEGIPPAERAQVFDVFYQVRRDGGRQQGSGLGLAICKGLVEAGGGTVWVADRPGPGTTISFTLPVAPNGA